MFFRFGGGEKGGSVRADGGRGEVGLLLKIQGVVSEEEEEEAGGGSTGATRMSCKEEGVRPSFFSGPTFPPRKDGS